MREGWEYKKLGDYAEIEYGTRVVQKRDGGTIYPVYGGGGETFRMDSFNREDCLIVARFAMSKCCVRYVEGKFFLNDSGLTVKAGEKLYQKYLNHNLLYLNDDIYHLSKGAAQRNLDVKAFKQLKIAIPPKSVQLEIVSELDQINELIRLKKEQLKDYDQLAQSIFYEMFGDPVMNEKGWEVKKLAKLADFKNGLNFTPVENGNRIRVIGVADFQDLNVLKSTDNIGFKIIEGSVLPDYYLQNGDILIVRSNGSKDLVGRNLVVYPNNEKITYSGFCIRCRIKKTDELLAVYLNAFLSKREIRKILRQEGRGANISNINQKILSSLTVILPPLPLQQEFASRIAQIEQLKTEVHKTIADLETLLASRMQYWFE